MVSLRKSLMAGCAGLAFVLLAGSVQAQEDKVVAKVNGQEIRESDIATAANDILPQLTRIAANQRLSFLVQFLVERYLIAEAAEKSDTAKSSQFRRSMAFYRRKALRDAYVRSEIGLKVGDKEIKTAYDQAIKGFTPNPEVRARHILVKTEKEAKDVVAKIKKGADFAELAKTASIGPSKTQGGDLGFFSKEKMVPAFSEAAFKLKKGEVSAPVKTDFGWHVIKLEDRRKIEIPPLERIRERIRNRLVRERVEQLSTELQSKAKIEYMYESAKPKPADPKSATPQPAKPK